MTNLFFLLTPLLLSSQLIADAPFQRNDAFYDAETIPSSTQPTPSANCGINLPAKPTVFHGDNVWIQAEALYWKAAEENLPYLIVRKNSTFDQPPFIGSIKNAELNWDWGFRLSAGYMVPHDHWDLQLSWTRIKNEGSKKNQASTPPAVATTFLQPGSYQNLLPEMIIRAHGKWEIELNQVELNLGRDFFAGRWLKLRPMGGVRTAWIDHESLDSYYNFNNETTFTYRSEWDFWGFGFVAGMQADWMLARDWSLFSFADYSILWGFFDVHQRGAPLTYHFKKSFRCARAVYDLGMGIKWSHLFSNQRWRLSFKAAYEYHLYPEQNQFLNNTNTVEPDISSGAFVNNSGDLAYQGLSLSAQIDF